MGKTKEFTTVVPLLAGILVIFGVCLVSPTPSQMYFYSDSTQENSKFYIYSQVNEPDTTTHTNLNTTNGAYHHFCSTGVWVGFFAPNYNGSYAGIFGSSHTSELICHQGYSYKSLRQTGVPEDISIPALSLYAYTSFSGDERLVVGDTPNFSLSYTSIVRAGNESWTLYTGSNYSGASQCFGLNFTHNIGFPLGSVRKGC